MAIEYERKMTQLKPTGYFRTLIRTNTGSCVWDMLYVLLYDSNKSAHRGWLLRVVVGGERIRTAVLLYIVGDLVGGWMGGFWIGAWVKFRSRWHGCNRTTKNAWCYATSCAVGN